MQKPLSYSGGNALLNQLVAVASKEVLREAVVVRFESGSVLLDSNARIEYVFFPLDMMISTTTLMRDAFEVEVGSIGCEGMSGVQLILGIDHVPGKAICQVAGTAVRIHADVFLNSVERSAGAFKLMLRYVQATLNLLEISIGCNALHAVTARCARWLLLTHDRVRRNEFGLTQEFLAQMLGVRRATINSVAQDLQEQGAIRYARGQMQIVDRARLERASCECYQVNVDRYDELLGQPPFERRNGTDGRN